MSTVATKATAVIVADAAIKGDVQLTLRPTSMIIVKPNQQLQLQCAYKFDEVSREKEEYIFTMRSEVVSLRGETAPMRAKPMTVRWEDRRALPDKGAGLLSGLYLLPKPGEYEGRFEVEAEYQVGAWADHGRTERKRKIAKGTVSIRVV